MVFRNIIYSFSESPPRRLTTDWILIEKDLVDGPLVDVQGNINDQYNIQAFFGSSPTYTEDLTGVQTHEVRIMTEYLLLLINTLRPQSSVMYMVICR